MVQARIFFLQSAEFSPDGRLLENRRVRPRARLERNGREEGSVAILERSATRWRFDVTAPSGVYIAVWESALKNYGPKNSFDRGAQLQVVWLDA